MDLTALAFGFAYAEPPRDATDSGRNYSVEYGDAMFFVLDSNQSIAAQRDLVRPTGAGPAPSRSGR